MRSRDISGFLDTLRNTPPLKHVFNPWADVNLENDIGEEGPKIRRRQLDNYLKGRRDTARYLLIGETIGYQGGHFTGIPMTSERILLGFQKERAIDPEDVLTDLKPRRTSRPENMERGFTEPTATIVWENLLKAGLKPREFILWNAFAYHPYDPKKGILSNRRPRVSEIDRAASFLSPSSRPKFSRWGHACERG